MHASSRDLSTLRTRYGERYRWLLLISVMIGTIAAIMSSTIVNVAIPELSAQFHLAQAQVQWVSSGFMIAMTTSMLTTPWLLSRYGYLKTYIGAMLLLTICGLAGGLANHFEFILAARVGEGLAAGVVQPIPAIIILRAFAPQEQGRASGLFGFGVILGPALGPSIGGVLIELFGWRSIFFMVMPFGILAILFALKYIPDSAPGGGTAGGHGALDWRGLILGAGATICLLNALIHFQDNNLIIAYSLLLSAVITFAVFIGWQYFQMHRGRTPLLDLSVFRHRAFAMGSIVSLIYGAALFGSTYLLPVFMQSGLQLSPAYVGTILLPAGLALAFTIPLAGRLADTQPIYKLVCIGLILLASSFLLMQTITLQTAPWLLVIWTLLGRVGLGFVLPSLNLGAMRPLPRTQIAQGASAISFMRMLGGSIGVSLCATVLQWRLIAHGDSLLHTASHSARISAFHQTFLLLAGLCIVALIAALQLRQPAKKSIVVS